jgi:hypothetical protein
MLPPFGVAGELSRQNGPGRAASVSVASSPLLFIRQTRVERPAESRNGEIVFILGQADLLGKGVEVALKAAITVRSRGFGAAAMRQGRRR